jgi:hypothetical protein
VDPERRRQRVEARERLHEEEDDVAEDEELQRLQVALAPPGEVLGREQPRPGEEREETPRNGRFEVGEDVERFGEEVVEGIVSRLDALLAAARAEALGDRPAALRTRRRLDGRSRRFFCENCLQAKPPGADFRPQLERAAL